MSNKKISELGQVTTLQATDVFPVVDSGTTQKATIQQVIDLTNGQLTGTINSLTGTVSASYLVLTASSALNNERVFTPSTGLSFTDAGANGAFTLRIDDRVTATVSGTTFTGVTKHTAGLSGSLTQLTDGRSFIVAGANMSITSASNGQIVITSLASGSGGGGADTGASYVVLAATSSLANERVLTAGTGLTLTDGGAGGPVTIGFTSVSSQSADVYNGYCTGALNWSATTWTDFRGVPGNFTDVIQNNIIRSGSTWTVSKDGYYKWHSQFDSFGSGGYLGFRLSGSAGTLLQFTSYANSDVHPCVLDGVIQLTSGSSFKLQYCAKTSAATFNVSDPLDGENMRTGKVNLIRVADPITISVVPNSSQSADTYNGYCTGSLSWTSTTWADFRNVPGNFTDTLQSGIIRSGSTWTVSRNGTYKWHSNFNAQVNAGYLAFRLSGSNGTLLQHTNFDNNQGALNSHLQGIISLTSGSSFKLQYVRKSGTNNTFTVSDPIDGENMRTGDITFFRVADPITISGSSYSSSDYTTYAAMGAAGNAGRRVIISDGCPVAEWVDDGAAWRPLVNGILLTKPPASASFTWVNQGTSTFNDTSGSITLITDANGTTNNRHLLVINTGSIGGGVTAKPYTLTVGMYLQLWPAPNPTIGGLVFRESSTGKFVEFITYFTGNTIHMATDKFSNPTTSAGAYDDGAVQPAITNTNGLWFMRVQDDGTNLNFYWSSDGKNFQKWLSSRSRTDYMTSGPDQVGLIAQSLDTDADRKVIMNVVHWKATTP